jgi:hypothetical protein
MYLEHSPLTTTRVHLWGTAETEVLSLISYRGVFGRAQAMFNKLVSL